MKKWARDMLVMRMLRPRSRLLSNQGTTFLIFNEGYMVGVNPTGLLLEGVVVVYQFTILASEHELWRNIVEYV